jgi:ATP phosphoribosyltransferase regulatory subunit
LDKALNLLASANQHVKQALAELNAIADSLTKTFPHLAVSFDLSELRGYHYHTGVVFAAFVPSVGREIARGGRYDNIGAVFGRSRPATGFSADLKLLATLSKTTFDAKQATLIFAPALNEPELTETIRALRANGQAVVQQLPGQIGSAQELGCSAVLEHDNQHWVVKPLTPSIA